MTREKTKRELLLEAAAVVFARHGFHNARVGEIANLAGVGKGTVYEYFASKQELFQELVVQGIEKLLRDIETETIPCPGAEAKLQKISFLHCRHIANSRDLTRVSLDGHDRFDPGLRRWMCEAQAKKTRLIREIIQEGVSAGEFRADLDCDMAAQAFVGTMASLFHRAVFDEELEQKALDSQAEAMVEILCFGMNKR